MESSLITLLPPKGMPNSRLGSLLMLFQSELFTSDMAMMYLNKKFSESGVRDFLINKIYYFKSEDLDFYLPELCYLAIKRESHEMEKLLYSKCSDSVPLYLKIYWYVNSFGEANRKDKKKFAKVQKMLSFCENSMVNGEIYEENSNKIKPVQELSMDPGEIVQKFQDKETRTTYTTAVNKFITDLIKISLTLKTFKPEQRKEKLLRYIKKANKILHLNKGKISTVFSPFNLSNYFEGICIPFGDFEEDEGHSNVMVRILEHDFACFNTKKRVPYKIVIETVDLQDFKTHSSKASPSEEKSSPLKKSSSQTHTQDWVIVEEQVQADPTTLTSEAIAQLKKDKYKGLLNFAAEVKAEEEKSSLGGKEATGFKFPNFLNVFNKMSLSPGKKRKLRKIEEEAKTHQIDLDKLEFIDKKDVIFRHLSKEFMDNVTEDMISKKTAEFMIKFPVKKLRRRNSYHHMYKISMGIEKAQGKRRGKKSHTLTPLNQKFEEEENVIRKIRIETIPEKPLAPKRKLSDKTNVDNDQKLDFIKSLRNESSIENNETINEILNKIELSIRKEISKGQPLASPSFARTPMAKHNGFWDELWEDKARRIKENSIYGHFPSYKLRCLIVKGGDDLRQELLAMQIIWKFKKIFRDASLSLYLRPYEIIVTSANSGILEFVPNTISLDGLKKKYPGMSLYAIFAKIYEFDFEEAQKNFIESLAAYSLVCYILQIKDRHNGNILIDSVGHIIHIDFGFMLGFSPGGVNFESAPFKLTNEYIELMGGRKSNMFMYFKILIMQGFMELRRHVDSIRYLLEIMMQESDLSCFTEFNLENFCARFEENTSDDEVIMRVLDINGF